MQIFYMDDLVSQHHLLQIIDKAINWNFIYGLVEDRYSNETRRLSIDNKKAQKQIATEEALFYKELLKKELTTDRELHGKKPLKDKDDKAPPSPPLWRKRYRLRKKIAQGRTNQEMQYNGSGKWLVPQREHKSLFAFAIGTACDKNGGILRYTVSQAIFMAAESLKDFTIRSKV